MLVAAPVCARGAQQLERVRRDLAGVVQVRPAAQVDEVIVLIGGDGRRFLGLLAIFVHAASLQPLDQLDLVGLVGEKLLGRDRADLLPDERILAGRDLAHAFLDRLQIFGREGFQRAVRVATQIKIVVETVLDRRPDGDARVREALDHRLGHHMRGGVAQLVQRFILLFEIMFA